MAACVLSAQNHVYLPVTRIPAMMLRTLPMEQKTNTQQNASFSHQLPWLWCLLTTIEKWLRSETQHVSHVVFKLTKLQIQSPVTGWQLCAKTPVYVNLKFCVISSVYSREQVGVEQNYWWGTVCHGPRYLYSIRAGIHTLTYLLDSGGEIPEASWILYFQQNIQVNLASLAWLL